MHMLRHRCQLALGAALAIGAVASAPLAASAAETAAGQGQTTGGSAYVVDDGGEESGGQEPTVGDSAYVTDKEDKVRTPVLEKLVRDADGTWDADWGKSSDASWADISTGKVTFRLETTLPEDIATKESIEKGAYWMRVTDRLPDGITATEESLADWGVTITYKGKDVSGLFETAVSSDGSSISWTIADAHKLDPADNADPIVIEYTPILGDEQAKSVTDVPLSLKTPITNTAHVTYKDGDGKDVDGPDSESKVYVYSLVINKVGSDGAPLTGAKFTLTDAEGNEIARDVTAADDGTFTFTGLDAGDYVVTETQAPEGMGAIEPIAITIGAVTDADGDVTRITATETSDPSNAATPAVADATVTLAVVNTAPPTIKKIFDDAGDMLQTGDGFTTAATAVLVVAVIGAACSVAWRRSHSDDEGR